MQAHFSPAPDKDESSLNAAIEATIVPPASGDLRIVLRRRDTHHKPSRAFDKKSMGNFFKIDAFQDGRVLPVAKNYDKTIWSGLSWAVGEIPRSDFTPGKPIELRLSTPDQDSTIHLDGQVFSVEY